MPQNLSPTNSNAMYGVDQHGRVILVDPNMVNSGPDTLGNEIPPLEEMTPYVELYCVRRTDTVITLGEDGKFKVDDTGSTTKVNMLNFDAPTEQNTTLWSEDLIGTNKRVNNEGFGIESIDITMGANYNPLVDITFRDIRGATLFSGGDKSPLAVIFDFPPPLYKLKIKGAFGRFVEYDLHMVDHNGASASGDGDYVLKCKFVGHYFGPLADMLIGYIKAAPFLRGEEKTVYQDDTTSNIVGGSSTNVNSFFELVNRGELLYTAVDNYAKQGGKLQATKQLTSYNQEIETIRNAFRAIGASPNFEFTNYMKSKNREGWISRIIIKSNEEPGKNYSFSYSFKRDALTHPEETELVTLINKYIRGSVVTIQKQHPVLGADSERPIKIDFASNKNVRFVETDVANQDYSYEIIYTNLVDNLNAIQQGNVDSETELKREMETDLRTIANETLGLAPTIGNIFEVLCKDFDYMMGAIRKAGETPKTAPAPGTGKYAVNGTMSWPFVQENNRIIKGQGNPGGKEKFQTVLVYPGVNPDFKSWPEVQLVERYCESLYQQQQAEQRYDNFKKAMDPSNYVPISPLEAYGQDLKNPYLGANSTSLPAIYTKLLERYTVTKDYTYGQLFDVQEKLPYAARSNWFTDTQGFDLEQRKALVQMQARLEAHNVSYVVQGTENMSAALRQTHTLAEVLDFVSQGGSPFLKTKGMKFGKFPFRTADDFLYRRGSVGEPQGNSGFNGITAIFDTPNTAFSKLYEVKVSDTSDPIDADRTRLLDQLATTSLFGDSESRKAKISSANILLYQDNKAANGSGKSDFINDGTDLWFTKVKFAGGNSGDDFYQLFSKSLFVQITKPVSNLFLPTFGRTRFASDDATIRKQIFSQLDDYSVLVNLYDGLFSGRSDVIAKFLTPGVVEMPRIYAMHLGFQFSDKDNTPSSIDNVLAVFGIKKKKVAPPTFISKQDREKFIAVYEAFDFSQFRDDVRSLWDVMGKYLDSAGVIKTDTDIDAFFVELAGKVKQMASVAELLKPVYVVNNSSMTFLDSHVISPERDGFLSLVRADGKVDDPTLTFFLDTFHAELRTLLTDANKAEQKATQDIQGKVQDPDFKANVYYNFKSLYDRWVIGTQGYREGELYERFKFITRSHQNIAQDCIVDFHSLLDDARNPDMSVFTSIGRLLQENNFMFYPLHSYMEYDGQGDRFDNWRKSWQIDNHLTDTNTSRPAFVCMYMGGFSSQVESVSTGSYGDDGFTFKENLPEDFSSGDDYMYAFVARVGSQGNSVFGFPDWNMEEFKPTDVSLKMESELLDKPTDSQKIRKSQNLMNIYQQRSYNVGMNIPLGNMCIQPTQYFQLEGMPFLNGAYMVHEVTHSIGSDSHMLETKFKGYRMGRFIHRIMTEYLLEYTGLSSEISNALNESSANSANIITSGANTRKLTDQQILELCKAYGYDYNVIKAFIKVESDGGGYDSQDRLKIQFEPKYFKRYTGIQIKNGIEGATAEWKAFNEAGASNLHAAKLSTSWGMGQIMGANHKAAGHNTVEDMVNAFETSEYNQLKGMLNFIKSNKALDRAIRTLDFPNIAKQYNGAGYRKYSYDTRLATAYQYYKSRPMPTPNGNFNFAAGDKVFKMVRQTYSDNSTIGALTLDGQFLCYVLEDKVRPAGEPVVRGKTAITAGIYPVDITMSNKFKRLMPEITKIPNQRGIRMHEGATSDDSLGCLILGDRKGVDRVSGSREAYERVFAVMKQIKDRGDGKMYIQVQDTAHA